MSGSEISAYEVEDLMVGVRSTDECLASRIVRSMRELMVLQHFTGRVWSSLVTDGGTAVDWNEIA